MFLILFIFLSQLQPAKFISFNGSLENKKVILQWKVTGNATAERFEVEKSSDRIHFSLAALVFASDIPDTAEYSFYEKVNSKKQFYRVKLINKDQQSEYSTIIGLDPSLKRTP
jgi:hypothetical protein